MSEMNDIARVTLRAAVLEARVRLRGALGKLATAHSAYKAAGEEVTHWRDHIVALQTAAGDPIDIDPTHPEIK